jgi:hypothetical protein
VLRRRFIYMRQGTHCTPGAASRVLDPTSLRYYQCDQVLSCLLTLGGWPTDVSLLRLVPISLDKPEPQAAAAAALTLKAQGSRTLAAAFPTLSWLYYLHRPIHWAKVYLVIHEPFDLSLKPLFTDAPRISKQVRPRLRLTCASNFPGYRNNIIAE